MVDHVVEYVRGRVHKNTTENFWSLVKRGLHGTYISMEPFHLFRDLDEQMFLFNNRKNLNGGQQFEICNEPAIRQTPHYVQLTGKSASPHHETTVAGETQIPFWPLS